MAKNSPSLSTREFSDLTGIPVSAVSRLVREGKIKGVKVSGKWLIDRAELNAEAIRALLKTKSHPKTSKPAGRVPQAQPAHGKKVEKHPSELPAKTFSVSEFSDLTYLTKKGVEEYLQKGRLQGVRDDKGNWRLGHEYLQNPGIRHLVR